jgi:hypothetical protein
MDQLLAGFNRVANATDSDSLKCRLRIGNFLRKWITENFHDFTDDAVSLLCSTKSTDRARLLFFVVRRIAAVYIALLW